jgi:hypothetical protein
MSSGCLKESCSGVMYISFVVSTFVVKDIVSLIQSRPRPRSYDHCLLSSLKNYALCAHVLIYAYLSCRCCVSV